ncbi:TPA: glycosyltransferase [Streptococcus suis]
MEKIFFYANVNIIDENSGITKKVKSQIQTMRKKGFEVYYTSYYPDGIGIYDNDDNLIFKKSFDINDKIFNKFKKWFLLKTVEDFLQSSKLVFDLSYIRFHYFDRSFNKMLALLKKSGTYNIVEAHSYPYRTFKTKRGLIINLIDYLFEPIGRKYIDLVAVIGHEKNIWGIQTVNIENAVDLAKIPPHEKILKENPSQITLISVAYEQKYHGYDRLLEGLKKYNNQSNNEKFNIIFVGKYLDSTKQLVKKLNLEEYVNFVGAKSGEELFSLYNQADIGIGGLGNRSNAEYGSTIKTKEYFAIGIPFINGWREYAFDDDYPYVLRFDWRRDEIDFNKIKEFYLSIKDDDSLTENMRQFAKKNFSYEKQFENILEKIKGNDYNS